MRLILQGRNPINFSPAPQGVVIFLGGDLLWAFLLKWRLRYRSIAYTEGLTTFSSFFDYFFLREKDGDLMTDAFHVGYQHLPTPVRRITFFPGSRPNHFRLLLPFYRDVAIILAAKGYDLSLGVSPFVSSVDVAQLAPYTSEGVFRFLQKDPADIFAQTDLLVTIPGTNTAQAAIYGVPFCVIVPINRPEEIPLQGLAGLIGSLPVVGKMIKKLAVRILIKQQRLYSLPSIKAGRLIVPELAGVLTPGQVADFIDRYARDPEQIHANVEQARQIMTHGGVLEKIMQGVSFLFPPDAEGRG